VDFLRANASLEGSHSCALDLGIVGFAAAGVERLLALADAMLQDRSPLVELLRRGGVRLDLYVELLMAFLSDVSFDQYCQKVRSHTRQNRPLLASIHMAVRDVDFRAFLTKRTQFHHFGSLREYPLSCEALAIAGTLPFYSGEDAEVRPVLSRTTVNFSSLDAICTPQPGARHVYQESCTRTNISSAGGFNLFIGLSDRCFSSPVPLGICLDERMTSVGRFLLVYGIDDTWQPQSNAGHVRFCGLLIVTWAAERGIAIERLFPVSGGTGTASYDLWDARLFVAGANEHTAEGYWNLACAGTPWRTRFMRSERMTIREIMDADQLADREARRATIRQELLRENILMSQGWLPVPELDFQTALRGADFNTLRSGYKKTDDALAGIYRRKLLDSLRPDRAIDDTVGNLRLSYLADGAPHKPLRRCVKNDQIVWARSPVRLDLAGGWADTPPFTLREGGEVVNIAVNLNDQPPIQVFCRPTEERRIRIHSIDLGDEETIRQLAQLEDFTHPGSPFSLPKAAFCLLGLTRARSGGLTLAEHLERLICCVEVSLLSAVPKGSGLGYLSAPGLKPQPIRYGLDPILFTDPGPSSRFTLYCTGITRLGKNILKDVVDRVNSMQPAYLFTLRFLKRIARSAREAIARHDLATLGETLNASWRANKLIHSSTTNDEVEALIDSMRGLFAGMKLLGAGGGGFVLFLSDSHDAACRLRDRLAAIDHERARVVDIKVNLDGLVVTTS
jgi:hypothetical protein